MTVTERIRKQVEQLPEGQPFKAAEMLRFGSRAAVDQALSRLSKTHNGIVRVTRGVYVRPKINKYVGLVLPEPQKVAEVITHSKIEVHGAEAARHFQLTTQVPTQPIYYTSGPSRTFRMGKLKIVLRHVSERKLELAGQEAGLALNALSYLGKENVTPSVIEKIKNKMSPSQFEKLKSATSLMPAWMSDALYRYENGQKARHA
jgi:hypothetical protein